MNSRIRGDGRERRAGPHPEEEGLLALVAAHVTHKLVLVVRPTLEHETEHAPPDAQVVLLGVGVVLRPVLVPGFAEEGALGCPRVGQRDDDVHGHEDGIEQHRIAGELHEHPAVGRVHLDRRALGVLELEDLTVHRVLVLVEQRRFVAVHLIRAVVERAIHRKRRGESDRDLVALVHLEADVAVDIDQQLHVVCEPLAQQPVDLLELLAFRVDLLHVEDVLVERRHDPTALASRTARPSARPSPQRVCGD